MAVKLTETREKWAKNREDALLVGKPLANNAAVAQRYQKKLDALIKRMRSEYDSEITRLYRDFGELTMDASLASQSRIVLNELGRKWEQIFSRASKDIVDSFVSQLNKAAKKDVEQSLKQLSGGLAIKVPEWPGDLQEKVKAAVNSNVKLIRNIPEEYSLRIEGIVNRSIESGQEGAATIYRELNKAGDITERRARTIAMDQTRKVTSAMNNERMKSAGVTKFRWRHSGGGKDPRRIHVQLDGQIFPLDDPPVIDEDGTRGMPGFLINCRCVAVPVLDFSADAD